MVSTSLWTERSPTLFLCLLMCFDRLPDNNEQDPFTSVPLTGLYPELRTNTPVHMSERQQTSWNSEFD